eukprot:8646858-Ditylum_brightwellii.AAC.1
MMWECDMLSRYNQATEAWRNKNGDEGEDVAKAESKTEQQPAGIPAAMLTSVKAHKGAWPTLSTLPAVSYEGEVHMPALGKAAWDSRRST